MDKKNFRRESFTKFLIQERLIVQFESNINSRSDSDSNKIEKVQFRDVVFISLKIWRFIDLFLSRKKESLNSFFSSFSLLQINYFHFVSISDFVHMYVHWSVCLNEMENTLRNKQKTNKYFGSHRYIYV